MSPREHTFGEKMLSAMRTQGNAIFYLAVADRPVSLLSEQET
jgi:hypothetical protein